MSALLLAALFLVLVCLTAAVVKVLDRQIQANRKDHR